MGKNFQFANAKRTYHLRNTVVDARQILQNRQCTCKVTLRRVCITIVDVEKQ